MASRLGLPARAVDFPSAGSGSALDFLSFDPPPCVQRDRRNDLRGDIRGRLVAGTSGVLVGADHPGVDPDRPLRTFDPVGVAAQLVEEILPGAIG